MRRLAAPGSSIGTNPKYRDLRHWAPGIDIGLADHHATGFHPSIFHTEFDQFIGHFLQKINMRLLRPSFGQMPMNTIIVQAVGQCCPGEPLHLPIHFDVNAYDLRGGMLDGMNANPDVDANIAQGEAVMAGQRVPHGDGPVR